MNKRFQSYFLSTLFIIALSALLCLIGGLVGTVLSILISVLFGVQITKYHYYYIGATGILILAVIGMMEGFLALFFVGIPILLIGFTLGIGANLKLSVYKIIGICTLVHLSDSLIRLKVLGAIFPEFSYDSIIANGYEMSKNLIYAANPGIDAQNLKLFMDALNEIMRLMILLTPASFIIISMVFSFITVVIFKKAEQKIGHDMSFLKPFYLLKADKVAGILFLMVLLLLYFAPSGLFKDVCINVIVVLFFIFFTFGLSLLDFKMKQGGVKKATRRLIFLCMLPVFVLFIFQPMLAAGDGSISNGLYSAGSMLTMLLLPFMAITGIGIADSLYDFRNKLNKGNTKS